MRTGVKSTQFPDDMKDEWYVALGVPAGMGKVGDSTFGMSNSDTNQLSCATSWQHHKVSQRTRFYNNTPDYRASTHDERSRGYGEPAPLHMHQH
eukprot:m.243665 g.243665  ORF g.243665 m.243665 type:complete len:94 (+) comp26364_c0_seq10:1195-1476(+)